MRSFSRPLEAQKIEKQIERLMEDEDKSQHQKTKYQKKQDSLIKSYKTVLTNWAESYKQKKFYVTQDDIFKVVSSKTGIPVGNLSKDDSDILLNLKKIIMYQLWILY